MTVFRMSAEKRLTFTDAIDIRDHGRRVHRTLLLLRREGDRSRLVVRLILLLLRWMQQVVLALEYVLATPVASVMTAI
jgi:hypothetical protein